MSGTKWFVVLFLPSVCMSGVVCMKVVWMVTPSLSASTGVAGILIVPRFSYGGPEVYREPAQV